MWGDNLVHPTRVVLGMVCGCVFYTLSASISCAKDLSSNDKGRASGEEIIFSNPTTSIRIPIQSWKTLRDARVVQQDFDYSCGAASLANLLSELDN